MRIGCVSLVFVKNKIVSIQCAKGRGIILPGGALEKGETFRQCASRELFEETGLLAVQQELLFHGPAHLEEDFYVYAFLTEIQKCSPKSSPEGQVVLASWEDLFKSKYQGYYELLHEAYHA